MKESIFAFVGKLPVVFIKLLGYPTIKVYSDYIELYFETYNTIRSLDVFDMIESDEFRLFPSSDGKLTVVYTFYSNV